MTETNTEKNLSHIPNLSLSESFYSIQGEGISSGVPSVFIRLRGCNFMCGGVGGSLMKEGKATWWCDTEAVWRQGVQTPFTTLIDQWEKEGILEWIASGRVHLIWTGGEPTMPKHQKDIIACLDYFKRYVKGRAEGIHEKGSLYFHPSGSKIVYPYIFNELETNGSLVIGELFNHLSQINCSPKLSNSGMDKDKRIVPEAIERIQAHTNHQFKFVVSTEADVLEVINDFITPFDLNPGRVVLMPGLDAQANFHERTRFVMEIAKKYGLVGLTRLHVSAWDKTTGV